MSNTSKQKRFRWLFALTVLTASSSGCGSWSHHVGKHSMLSYFHKKHHSPYTQCEDCGQIIVNNRYHQCNQCAPQPAFYGFKSTCWNAWPMGWSPCPAPASNSCLIEGESVVLQESVAVPAPPPQDPVSDAPSVPTVAKELPTKAIVPPPQDEPDPVSEDATTQEKGPITEERSEAPDDSTAIAPSVLDEVAEAHPSSPSLVEQQNEDKDLELEGSFAKASSTESTDEDPTAQEASKKVTELSSSEEESLASPVDDVEVHVEKTTPAISTSFELPSVPKTLPPVPVAPASAVVTALPRSETFVNEVSSEPVVSDSKSKFAELKRLLKESRSTALHLSHAKQPEGQVSKDSSESIGLEPASTECMADRIASDAADEKNHKIHPAILAMPVSKKVSLLDRLCPKSTN